LGADERPADVGRKAYRIGTEEKLAQTLRTLPHKVALGPSPPL